MSTPKEVLALLEVELEKAERLCASQFASVREQEKRGSKAYKAAQQLSKVRQHRQWLLDQIKALKKCQ